MLTNNEFKEWKKKKNDWTQHLIIIMCYIK